MKKSIYVLIVMILGAILFGCTKKGIVKPTYLVDVTYNPTTFYSSIKEEPKLDQISIIYFDTNSSEIKYKEALTDNISKNFEGKNISISGFCDIRGSIQYNNNLGMKRAEAVALLLTLSKNKVKIMSVNSYGKSKARKGRSEKVWKLDRKVEIKEVK